MTLHDAWKSATWQRLTPRLYVLALASVLLAMVTAAMLARFTASDDSGRFEPRALKYLFARLEEKLDDPAARDAEIAIIGSNTLIDIVLVDKETGVVVARTTDEKLVVNGARFGPPAIAVELVSKSGHPYQAIAALPGPRAPRFAMFGAALLVVLAVSSLLFAGLLASPLANVARAANAFGEGDLLARVDEKKAGPFVGLATVFNEMADRIKSGVRSERELLANVSHELRTPLSRIRVALELADTNDAQMTKESLSEIATDLGELEHIIDDVLTAARLDGRLRDALPIHIGVVSLHDLVEASAQRFRAHHADHPLDVDTDDTSDVDIDADATLLRRALDNLLDNAAKYSPQNARVSLIAKATADTIAIDVVDTGIGIDAEDVEKLFTPFFRAEKSRSKRTGGVGLGLVIVKRVVEAHGGTIEVESAPERGTRMQIRIPRTSSSRDFTGVALSRVDT